MQALPVLTFFLGLLATGMFNKSDNRDLFTGNTFEVIDADEESQPAGLSFVHQGLSSDCVRSVKLPSGNGVKFDNGHSKLLDVDEELQLGLSIGSRVIHVTVVTQAQVVCLICTPKPKG